MDIEQLKEIEANITDEEKRENAIRLGFNGDQHRFDEFCRVLHEERQALRDLVRSSKADELVPKLIASIRESVFDERDGRLHPPPDDPSGDPPSKTP